MELMDLALRFWPMIVAFVAAVYWFSRLEGGMRQNAADVRALWRQRNEDLESHRRARDETNAGIAKMEAKIDKGFEEVRNDIKELLRQERS